MRYSQSSRLRIPLVLGLPSPTTEPYPNGDNLQHITRRVRFAHPSIHPRPSQSQTTDHRSHISSLSSSSSVSSTARFQRTSSPLAVRCGASHSTYSYFITSSIAVLLFWLEGFEANIKAYTRDIVRPSERARCLIDVGRGWGTWCVPGVITNSVAVVVYLVITFFFIFYL